MLPDTDTEKKLCSKANYRRLSIADRVPMLEEIETYITIIDHKSEFPNKTLCCFINPSKSNIRKVSKVILDKINEKIISSVTINQRKNKSAVLKWYSKILSKTQCSFIQFDIEIFYPSITPGL